MLWTSIVFVAVVVLPLTSARIARGQGAADDADSVAVVPATATPEVPFEIPTLRFTITPVYSGKINGDVTSVSMGNELRTSATGWGGLTVNAILTLDERHYRLQDRLEDNKRFNTTLMKNFSKNFSGSLGYDDSRRFNRVVALSGSLQDFVLNDESASAALTYTTVDPSPLRWDARANGALVSSEKTYKDDRTAAGALGGGVRYGFGDERVIVGVRAAMRETSEESRSQLDSLFTGLGSSEDSLVTSLRVNVNDSLRVGVDYFDYDGSRVFADQARGSLGAQQEGAENVFQEEEIKDSRKITLNLDTRFLRAVRLRVTSFHDEQTTDYAIQKTRFSRTVTDALDGDLTYTMPWKTGVSLKIGNRETLRDLGPLSVSSYNEVAKKVSLGLNHRFSRTMNVQVNLANSISQTFYIDFEANPRDRDQVDASANVLISSTIFSKVRTSISLALTSTEFVSISASQSGNNRTRTVYDFRPSFTYAVNDRLTIEQAYGLSLEFTDYTFREEDNQLDRNVTFSNEFKTKLFPHVNFDFYYALRLHDAGSYLPLVPGGERYLTVTNEDRSDRIRLRLGYELNEHLRLVSDYDYNRREDTTPGSSRVSVVEDGGIGGGAIGQYNWGTGKDLSFTLKRIKRFSPFSNEAQNDYWEMNMRVTYTF